MTTHEFYNRKSIDAFMNEQSADVDFQITQAKGDAAFYPGTTTKKVFFVCGSQSGICSEQVAANYTNDDYRIDAITGRNPETNEEYTMLIKGAEVAHTRKRK